jgi:hypothetical protein
MKVFVIMGNDYPVAVFKDETAAEMFCEKKKAERERLTRDGFEPRIYWRYYEFNLNEEKT